MTTHNKSSVKQGLYLLSTRSRSGAFYAHPTTTWPLLSPLLLLLLLLLPPLRPSPSLTPVAALETPTHLPAAAVHDSVANSLTRWNNAVYGRNYENSEDTDNVLLDSDDSGLVGFNTWEDCGVEEESKYEGA
ncbi:hypothetical protein PG993_008191 [Apiospora rasikravindrae]|uniref:Uncharacterized protein n=1 Tax=Apiospora rasikravindrae TaxID=990691 RepID=A0ABR1SZM8_9PEZI